MEQATANITEILDSEKLEVAELERLRKAAFASEGTWRDLRKAVTAPAAKGLSLARRVKRAAALLLIGRSQAAIRELEEAKAGQDPVGALVLGRAWLESRDPKKAAEAFEAGLKKAKGDFDLTMGAIEAQREGGDAEGALKAARALEGKLGKEAELHFQIAASIEAVGDYDVAMDAYEEAIDRDPGHARTLFRLAYNHELHGSLELAEDYYKKCTDLNPTYPNALINYGLMLEDRSRYKDAKDVYERVLRVRPNHPRAKLFWKDADASLDMYYDEDQEKKSDRRNAILRIPVTDFELSVRARNCLNKMNIRNLGDLVTKTEEELLAYKNFGETSLQEIKQMLAQKGLRLGMFREGAGTPVPAPAADEQKRAGDEEILKKPISELELSVRSRNCMERLNIRTIGELVQKSEAELLAVKNFGQTSLNEIKQRLGELGLALEPDPVGPGGVKPPGLRPGMPGLGGAAAALGMLGLTGAGPLDGLEPEATGASVVSADEIEDEIDEDELEPDDADADAE